MTTNRNEPKARISRRRLLTAGVGGSVVAVTSAAAGVSAGTKTGNEPLRAESRFFRNLMRGKEDFDRMAEEIIHRHDSQDEETVLSLRAKYETPVFGKVRVWELIEKLAFCVDPTDQTLYCTNQYIHVQQILQGMERDGLTDTDLILAALTHDLGKVALLTDEVPENIVCFVRPISEYGEGVGLDNVICQFGHDEIVYSRLKDHVSDFVSWLSRYHSMHPEDMLPHLDERDHRYFEKYLTFREYDQGTKSVAFFPQVNMEKYRELIEEAFPTPILF